MRLLGLDVGTTGVKAVVFDESGATLGSGYREVPVLTDPSGRAEQEAEVVWRELAAAVREAVTTSRSREVAAAGVSVQGDAIIPIDRELRPLGPAILGMDYRSAPEARDAEATLGAKDLFRLTGMRPHPMNSLCKLLWLRSHRPDVYRRAWKITTYADFVAAKLTGDPVIDASMASRTMAYELEARRWSPSILGRLDVNPALFSPVAPCGRDVGALRPATASELGLPPGVRVVTGGHDQVCAAIGAGLVSEGLGVVSTGTAEVLSTAFVKPRLSDAMFDGYYPCYLYARDGFYFTFSLNHTGGLLLQWYRDNFGSAEVEEARRLGIGAFELIDRRAAEARGDLLVLPHFNGSGTPLCDTGSRGAIVGLTLASTRHDIARALLECQSYELALNVEAMAKAGVRVDRLVAVGGGARSTLWLQIKADVLGRTIDVPRIREGACFGAALLAGTAAGAWKDIDEAVAACVRMERSYEPDAGRSSRHAERYALYKELHPALAAINGRLA
jgi:xylulokinase